jgi:signal transduction histidine kinase/CheY-like chemotaxis protein
MKVAVSASEQRFLLLAPTGRDGRLASRLLEEAGLASAVCRDLDEVIAACREGAAGLFIAEEVLSRAALDRLAGLLAEQEPWSDLPILVFTSIRAENSVVGAGHAWLLRRLGNVTLLDRPLRPFALVSAAQTALRARMRQYASRAALTEQARAVEHRDQFLAMLGHELRNPLSAIQLAGESARASGDERRMDQVVRRQTAHLTRLVDDLLDVSRVTSGKLVLHTEVADLREVVERGSASLEVEMRSRNLELEIDLPDRPLPVDIDVIRIEQVLSNLLTNAIKYTGPGGRIRVAGVSDGTSAHIEVEDTGAGIAADKLDVVFDLFSQVDATLERSRGGLGIGLTLVRRILELHGGSITVQSPGLGKGSTFIASLPLAAGAVLSPPAAPLPAAAREGGAPIVLVEDHDDSRELLCELLQTWGHRVTATASGRDGVRAAIAQHPQVMIIDIGLPELDGYSVARRVREVLGSDVYLIALTGYGQPGDRSRAVEAGFDIHITKPVDTATLLDLVAHRVRPPESRAVAGDASP